MGNTIDSTIKTVSTDEYYVQRKLLGAGVSGEAWVVELKDRKNPNIPKQYFCMKNFNRFNEDTINEFKQECAAYKSLAIDSSGKKVP